MINDNFHPQIKNINQIKNRFFILSPSVKNNLDNESSRDDFTQEGGCKINLGYIGKGLKVTHKKTNKMYSIKAMKKEKIIKANKVSIINRQLDKMYKVKHESFLRLLNHFENDENLFLIYQCINESTLLDKIKSHTLERPIIMKYLKQILIAVRYLHQLDIIYVSLEPDSIIIDDQDNVRLTDYGWSKVINIEMNKRKGHQDKNGTYINAYTPPELVIKPHGDKKAFINRNNASTKSDIWQIGILLFEMINGFMPFNEYNVVKGLENAKIDYSSIEKDSPEIKELLEMMLKAKPSDRAEIKDILNFPVLSGQEVTYQLTPMENDDDIIYRGDRKKTPQEELIFQYKKENEKLRREIAKMKTEINSLTKENTEIKNRSKQLEDLFSSPNPELTEEIVGYKSQIRLLNNEITIANMSLQKEKDKVNELQTRINELNKEIEEKDLSNDNLVAELQNKIETLEAKKFGADNPQSTSDFLQYYLPIFNDNVKEFKNLIDKSVVVADISKDSFITKVRTVLDDKESGFKAILDILKDSYENNNFFKINLSDIENKSNNEKEEWFQKQINELIPFKNKCLRLEEMKTKVDNENNILKEQLQLIQEKCDNLQQIQELSSEKLNTEIEKLSKQIQNSSDFILKHCPEKYEQFKIILTK